MTKRHFEAAALIVRDTGRGCTMEETSAIYAAFVELFSQFNPRFDVERFRKACGL